MRTTLPSGKTIAAALAFFALLLPCPVPAAAPTGPGWVTASYEALLDSGEIVRTGQKLVEARTNPALKAALQPFLAPYSRLLPYMLEMVAGPAPFPYADLAGRFPAGSAQPAWAAILREGRILVTADGAGHARVFLPGESARKAYDRSYHLLRLPLATLLPRGGAPLSVEVFAYVNDYPAGELSLQTTPHQVKVSSLPAKKQPLDRAALEGFFSRGLVPEGGRIDPDRGLVLYGRPGSAPTLAGGKITLADLAVAYRAAFYAGDNSAFVSLDPNPDPTRVRANFGGLLEDTRIGRVLLDADKRFKTLTAGIDPETLLDQRGAIRRAVPGFLSTAERDLLPVAPGAPRNQWVSTRLWFYPESIRVETDPGQEVARITSARLRADAERLRQDFSSPDDFMRDKKSLLTPSMRAGIEDLNRRYPQYAKAFPELAELETVGRLMGLAAWLKRSPAVEAVDLESLLAETLPPFSTERERARLITVSAVAHAGTVPLTPALISDRSAVEVIGGALDRRVADFYPSPEAFARAWSGRGAPAYEASRDRKVRELIRNEDDLRRAVDQAALGFAPPAPEEHGRMAGELEAAKAEALRLNAEAAAMGQPSSGEEIDRYNALLARYNELREKAQGTIALMRAVPVTRLVVAQINGGIDLDPASITLSRKELSPALREMTGEGWVSSESFSSSPPRPRAAAPSAPKAPAPAVRSRAAPQAPPRAAAKSSPAPAPAPAPAPVPALVRGPATLTIPGLPLGPGSGVVVGKMERTGRIVFTPASGTP